MAAAADALEQAVNERLDHLNRDGGSARAIVVAHSMGGLVARHWLLRPGQAELCKGLVTLGTPHRGAPKALGIAVNGVTAKGLHLCRVSKVVQRWPGLFDLVSQEPVIRVEGTGHDPARWLDAASLHALPHPDEIERADKLHRSISDGWNQLRSKEKNPPLRVCAGVGHGTSESYEWTGGKLVPDPRRGADAEALAGSPSDGQPAGDSTVPFTAAFPFESLAEFRQADRLGQRHGDLHDTGDVVRAVEQLAGKTPATRGREEQREQIGLTVDDLTTPGATLTVEATVMSTPPEKGGARLDATWLPVRNGARELDRLESRATAVDGGRWQASFEVEVPDEGPGALELNVVAPGTNGRMLAGRELIGVCA